MSSGMLGVLHACALNAGARFSKHNYNFRHHARPPSAIGSGGSRLIFYTFALFMVPPLHIMRVTEHFTPRLVYRSLSNACLLFCAVHTTQFMKATTINMIVSSAIDRQTRVATLSLLGLPLGRASSICGTKGLELTLEYTEQIRNTDKHLLWCFKLSQ
jgi:hypothetical protein